MFRRLAMTAATSCVFLAAPWAWAEQEKMIEEVSTLLAEAPQDDVLVGESQDAQVSMKSHHLTVSGKPAEKQEIDLWDNARCEWVMPTAQAGQYVVSLFLISGDKRPGKFGYFAGDKEHVSREFHEQSPPGKLAGCLKAFRITIPEGQKQTRMYVTGNGLLFCRAYISRVTRPSDNAEEKIGKLATSSYRTVLRTANAADKPACIILAPKEGVEGRLGKELAESLKLPLAIEPDLKDPFPAFPSVPGATSDTNLILLSAGAGGPLTKAMRRAGLIAEDHAIPGPGGYIIRTVPRPFTGKANVIVISAGDEEGLAKGVKAFAPKSDEKTGELVWEKFLVDSPGKQWAKMRPWLHSRYDTDPSWGKAMADLNQPFGGAKGSRSFIDMTATYAREYWVTGNDKFAEVVKARLVRMEKDDIYGNDLKGADSHMALYALIQAWDRVEESPVFSAEDRLSLTNYLLKRCVEGNEGFGLAYAGFRQYSGAVRMRHNHQTVLGAGLMQAYLYFGRLYGLGRARMWKDWCDDIVLNGTYWGHAPEDAVNYELRSFLEVADMLHYQGLSTKGHEGTRNWPAVAARFMGVRDSFALPACYGDCWNSTEFDDNMKFMELMRDEWDWPAAQFAIDRLIRGYRYLGIEPKSDYAETVYAYLQGSTEVGGSLKPSDPARLGEALKPLTGLMALPMTEGYWKYTTGQIGNKDFWDKRGRPEAIPYDRTADKVVYRSGWGTDDEYLLLDTIGWAAHGHMDLGTIVQYCQGGRLWIVDFGYDNTGPDHHSTLDVKRDGKPAWGQYEGLVKRWGDFRAGPQMFEILKLEPDAATSTKAATSKLPLAASQSAKAGPFAVTCRARNMAGATWIRSIAGGDGRPLVVEDTLTADQAGQYEIIFRLRLLGAVEGQNGKWTVRQKGSVLPVTLELSDGDDVALGKWMPDAGIHRDGGAAYPWYPFADKGGIPKTIEWKRKIKLDAGQSTVLKANLGPAEKG